MRKLLFLFLLAAMVVPVYAQNNDIFIFGGMYDQSKMEETGYTSHNYEYPDLMTAQDSGSLSTKTDGQFGLGLLYARKLNDRLYLEVGYENFDNDLDVTSTFSGSYTNAAGGEGSLTDARIYHGSVSNAIFQLNARYYFTDPGKSFRVYGVIGGGLQTIHLDAEGTAWFPVANFDFINGSSELYYPLRVKADGFNTMTVNLGVGGDYMFSDHIGVTFDLRYFYALTNESVIWHVMPGEYSDVTGEADPLGVGCDDNGCNNYNLAGQYDAWFDYSIKTKPSAYRGVVGIKFVF